MLLEGSNNELKNYVISLRREIHQNPEPSWMEVNTSRIVKRELDKLGVPYKEIAKTGVVAWIDGSNPGKTVALRADMDALQVNEETGVDYASQNEGVMHACGHDAHTAMLIGAAKVLKDNEASIKGRVKLLFQPAEELAQGAQLMIEEGAMDGVDSIFGIHIWSDLPCGKVSVEAGPRMASADIFKIRVAGKGGHGSLPHQGVDAVVVAAAIIMNLQSIVSREISPLEASVVSIGKVVSGTRFNVISDKAEMDGTTRCFNNDIRNSFEEIINRVIKNTASAYRASAELEYNYGTPATINSECASETAKGAIKKLLGNRGIEKMEKVTGAEDFAMYLEKAPGALAFVGVRNEEKDAVYPHHHPKFKIDEDGLEIGTKLYAQYALDYLNQ